MGFDFDTIIDRRTGDSIKWRKYRGRDILPLWVADMDFASPPAVLAALHARVDHGVFGYAAPPDELVDVALELLRREHDWAVDPAWLVWLPGLVSGIHLCCRAVGEPGDAVLTTVPIYPPFLTAPPLSDRARIDVPLIEVDGRAEMDLERMAAAITARTRLFLLCNPHNPAGRIFTRAELEAVATLCLQHDLVLCADEIHCQLLLEPGRRHVSIATLAPEVAARTITLLAPSKSYNIAGLGCSLAVIPDPELRRRFERAAAGIVPHVNLLGYAATLAAWREGAPWLAALLDHLRDNRDRVVEKIAALPGLSVTRPEATYLAWIDARPLGLDHPAAWFEARGLGLSDGREFGAPGFLRLNFGCPRTLLDEALERLARAVQA